MTHYNKLVRDKIPEILDHKGVAYEQRRADEAEYRNELIKKLGEETAEFTADPTVEELADVLEVVRALEALPEYRSLERVRQAKVDERGAFAKRLILKGEK